MDSRTDASTCMFSKPHGEVVEDAAGDAVRGECTGKVSPTVVIEPS